MKYFIKWSHSIILCYKYDGSLDYLHLNTNNAKIDSGWTTLEDSSTVIQLEGNSDAVNEWGVNLLSSMNEGRAPLEALVTNKAIQLGKVPRRTIIENIDLPDITQPKTDNRLNNSPVASVPSYSSINPFDTDIAKAQIHYGFSEFI